MITYKSFIFTNKEREEIKLAYCCPDNEFMTQINEVFHLEDYALAKQKKNMVVVDLGANVGSVFYYLKDYVKEYHAVEPEPHIFECLVQNTKRFKKVHRYNYGIYGAEGTFKAYSESEDTPPQSLLQSGNYVVDVQVKNFDTFMRESKLTHIDVLKVDTEGSEYAIFASDEFIKHASKIDFIIGEAHFIDGQPDMIIPILKDAGFEAKFLPNKNYDRTLTITNHLTGKEKKYTVTDSTIFVAERIDTIGNKAII